MTKALLGVVAAALAFAGSARADDTIRFGTVGLKGDAGIVLMGTEDQFDKANGVDIEPVAMKGDSIILKAVIAGQMEAYVGSPGAPIMAAAQGADIKVLGCPWPGLTYGLFTRPEITSVEGLKGGSIGTSAPGSLPDLFARAVLEQAGLSADDVKIVSSGSAADRVQAVKAGVLTAAPSSSEFNAIAPGLGLHMLLNGIDATPKFLRLCIMTTGAQIAEHREAMVNFMAAELQAYAYVMNHEDEVLALSKKFTGQDDPAAAYIWKEATDKGALAPSMDVDADKLQWLADLLVSTGNLKEKFDTSSMIDTSILEAAKKKIGATN